MLHPGPFTPSGTDVLETEWAPGSVCTGAENVALGGIRSPDCPTCSGSPSNRGLGCMEHRCALTAVRVLALSVVAVSFGCTK